MAARKQAPPPRQNRLLAFLPKDVQQRLMPEFETIFLRVRDLLHEANQRIEHVYFPLNVVLSLVATMQSGMAIEVATIGNEGMLGLPLFLGVDRTPVQALSQVAVSLQKAGLIQYRRGMIRILDRRRLERRACDCYRIIRDEYIRLFGASV